MLGDAIASSRDALHMAVMCRYGIDAIMSFDKCFERYPGIRRLC